MTPTELWTFGHSTRSAPETVELLRDNRIGRVVDVRSIAGSRHNPQFGAQAMAEWLPGAGIDYGRIEALGGRRRTRGVDPEINAGWTNDSFHAYADWTLGEEFEQGLAALGDLVAEPGTRAAIMCAEAVPWRCHRSLIATVLVLRGWRVRHILGPGQLIDHRPGQWGPAPVVRPDGHVVYPAAQASLFN
jgi:uncharacterized protein (DUF488 family)